MTTKLERYWHNDDWGWCWMLVLYVRGVAVLTKFNVQPESEAFWAGVLRRQYADMAR